MHRSSAYPWGLKLSFKSFTVIMCIFYGAHTIVCVCLWDSDWLIDDSCRAGGHWVICGCWEVHGWRGNRWKISEEGGLEETKLGRGRLSVRLPLMPHGKLVPPLLKGTAIKAGNQNNVGKEKIQGWRGKGKRSTVVAQKRNEKLGIALLWGR